MVIFSGGMAEGHVWFCGVTQQGSVFISVFYVTNGGNERAGSSGLGTGELSQLLTHYLSGRVSPPQNWFQCCWHRRAGPQPSPMALRERLAPPPAHLLTPSTSRHGNRKAGPVGHHMSRKAGPGPLLRGMVLVQA